MFRIPGTRCLRAWLLPVSAVFAFTFTFSASAAIPLQKPQGRLSPVLSALSEPATRSKPVDAQARALGIVPTGPGSLIRTGNRVLVNVRFDGGAVAAVPALRASGARVVTASRRYQAVTARVAPADLRAIARTPGVTAVSQVRSPILRLVNCDGGSVITEGIGQLNVEAAREGFNLDGEGLTVGVLSDSFDQATKAVTGGALAADRKKDEETADLPGPENKKCAGQEEEVNVLQRYVFGEGEEEPFDEGRAMLQIVHDIAPQANLAFDSAFNGELKFAEGIEDLAKPTPAGAGADVIVDDVAYFEEPFFQDGPVANAVNKVTSEGVPYLSAAGNDNLFDPEGHEIASWEAPAYRDSGDCPAEVRKLAELNAHHCLDFNPGAATDRTFGIRVEPGEILSVDLQWAEPWSGVNTDLDAFLLDAQGRLLTGSAEDNSKSQEPLEIVQWTNNSASEKTVQLVVNRFSGSASPPLKFILVQNGSGVSGTEYPKSGEGDVVGPAVFGHSGTSGAIGVGAVRFEPRAGEGEGPEPYSSRGPVTHYFGPVAGFPKKTPTPLPAAPLLPPEVISKPDVVATDCGRTTFFAVQPNPVSEPSLWRFCGTSAAAPHAAGIAALMLEAEPGASPEEVREAMAGTGSPLPGFHSCAVGGGLVEALGATEAIRGGTSTQPGLCEPPNANEAVFVAPGEWGLEEPPPPASPPAPAPAPVPPGPAPPVTRFVQHPPKVIRIHAAKAKVVFRFGSDQAGSTFRCKLDRAPFQACGARFVRRLAPGQHLLKVVARSPAGLSDPSPAVFRFRIKRV